MKVNIFEIKEMEENALFELARQTIDSFSILKEIYDDEFLDELIKRRFYFDNYLLWLLVSKQSFTYLTWKNIAENLSALQDSDGILHFKPKLRSRLYYVFKSYQTELEYAGYYKIKGYDVELEPKNADSEKVPEFKIESNGIRVYFEAKNIFWDEIIQTDKLETQIQGALGKIDLPFVFSIYHKPGFSIDMIANLKRFFLNKVNKIDSKQIFPFTLYFPSEKHVLTEIVVFGNPNKLSYGYLGGISRGVAMSPGTKPLRRKISKKVSQLPKNEANVIIIEPGHFLLDEVDINYALFGDEKLRIYKDGSTEPIRASNGILAHDKNTRLSAVLFSKKIWDRQNLKRKEFVFHNPFAKKGLNEEFFTNGNVQQFVPVFEEEAIRMIWKS